VTGTGEPGIGIEICAITPKKRTPPLMSANRELNVFREISARRRVAVGWVIDIEAPDFKLWEKPTGTRIYA
jgi:hypothetical protein